MPSPEFSSGAPGSFRQPRATLPIPEKQCREASGFTLVELLVVMAVIVVIMAIVVPVVRGIKGARDITKAAYDVSGSIETARAFAIANNTYTWVGFYEESASKSSDPNHVPPDYPGTGRVLIATVASKDGTSLGEDNSAAGVQIPTSGLAPINRLSRIEGVTLADLADVTVASTPYPANARSDSLEVRSSIPYEATQNRIMSKGNDKTSHPFVAQNYTFYKTIRFNPRGEAKINGAIACRVAEVGLRPTRGAVVDRATLNVVAIQFTGVSGNVTTYRR